MYSFLEGLSSCGRLYAVQTGSPLNNLINCTQYVHSKTMISPTEKIHES